MKTKMRITLIASLLLGYCAWGNHGNLQNAPTTADSCRPSELKKYEAEILIYLTPEASEARKAGEKVSWELQSSVKLNQNDFFVFYLYNVGAPESSSPTIGYFAVNKHTAEVWNMNSKELLHSAELLSVGEIFRRGHCIDEQTVRSYSSAKPDIASGTNSKK
jgi:hypothetical protein